MVGEYGTLRLMDERPDHRSNTTRTSCALDCPDRCAVLVDWTGLQDRDLRLSGDPAHPFTNGLLCRKIHRYPDRLTSPQRILHPWMRTAGRSGPFRPATWDEAMNAAVGAITRARAEDPASVLAIRSMGSMGAGKDFADYLFGRLGARDVTGSLCDIAGIEAVKADAGSLSMNHPSEIDRAEVIVLWGKNPRASSIHTAAQIVGARRRGTRVIAVTPDASGIRGLADQTIRVRPGRDRFLALAVAKLLLPEVRPPWERASGREEFETLLSRFSVADLVAACDVSEADARALAAGYAAGPRVATIVGWGVQRYATGGETVRALHALSFLAGSLGGKGGGFYFNVSSAGRFVGIDRLLREAAAPQRRTPALRLPLLGKELPTADPPVRVAWLAATNIISQGLDSHALRAAFEGVETVVAVEAFWTETARAATIVLPPALWLEEEDVVGSLWTGELAAVRRIVGPPKGCRTDFEILQDLATRLGISTPYRSLDEWLCARLPGGEHQLKKLRAKGWIDSAGESVAWRNGFDHSDGRFHLLSSMTPVSEADGRDGSEVEAPIDAEHPLHLLTLIRREAMHSQMTSEEQAVPLAVRLHPATAAAHRLGEGAPVRIVGRAGALEGMLRLDPGLHEDAVACPRGGWIEHGQGVNVATEAAVTDLGDGAAYYSTMVRVEPV